MLYYSILIIRSVKRAFLIMRRKKTGHIILIYIHIADISLIVLIIDIVIT